MIPIEGIDKVKVMLNPYALNTQNTMWHIDPHNRLTLHHAGPYTMLSIHAEYFNLNEDYQFQIAKAICELIQKGIILFTCNEKTLSFIYNNPYYFILRVTALEFYSNFRPDNVIISEIALENEMITQYVNPETKEVYDTFYAGAYNPKKGKKSIFINYDKDKKNRQDRNIPWSDLDANPNKRRIEFRVESSNTSWLNWYNLRGNYFDIFKRYSNFLAVFYCNYLYGNIETYGRETKSFNKIKKKAETMYDNNGDRPFRYRGKELKQMEKLNKSMAHPERITQDERCYMHYTAVEHFNNFMKQQKNSV